MYDFMNHFLLFPDKEKRDLTKEKDKLEDRLVTIRVTLNELSEQLQDEQDKNKTLKVLEASTKVFITFARMARLCFRCCVLICRSTAYN